MARPVWVPISIVPSWFSSHQSPRIRRTGSMPSKSCPGPKETNAPAPISPTTSPVKVASQPTRPSSRSSRKHSATSSASLSIVMASRSRPDVHGPAAVTAARSGAGSSPPIDRGEQGAVTDQVRIAADGRGEVAVAGRLEAGVTQIAVVVVGLLEGPQDQPRQSPPAPSPAWPSTGSTSWEASPASSAACCWLNAPLGTGGVGTPSEASWSIIRCTEAPSGRSCTR